MGGHLSSSSSSPMDLLHISGYYLYGAFFNRRSLAKGLAKLACDIAAGDMSNPVVLNLNEAIRNGGYSGTLVYEPKKDGVSSLFPYSDVQLIYAKPKREIVETEELCVRRVILKNNKREHIILRSVPLKKGRD